MLLFDSMSVSNIAFVDVSGRVSSLVEFNFIFSPEKSAFLPYLELGN